MIGGEKMGISEFTKAVLNRAKSIKESIGFIAGDVKKDVEEVIQEKKRNI